MFDGGHGVNVLLKMKPIENLLVAMERSARFARESVRRGEAEFGAAWSNDFSEMLERLYADDSAMGDAVQGYSAFVIDSMRRQKRFERELCYPAKTYADATAEVYCNDDHMWRQYLPGLLLSHYLWPHHYRQIEYFKTFFLSMLCRHQVTEFAEVGVGTGIYSRLTLQAVPEIRGAGFDISPMSLRFTLGHVAAYGHADRYSAIKHNILEQPNDKTYRALICVEVLEHMEDPLVLLKSLKSMCAADGKMFVTAALNAADADHIYLYRQPQDVLDQVAAAGLYLEHCFFVQAYAPAAPGLPVPAALAMVLGPGV